MPQGTFLKDNEALQMRQLEVRLFGTPRFSYDGVPWLFTAPPACLPLLGLLAVLDKPIKRATLAATLWPDQTGANARANLRRHIYRLHRALPPVSHTAWLVDTAQTIAWNADAPAWFDVRHFRRNVVTADARDAALDLHTGEFLMGFDDEWLLTERERLHAILCDGLIDASVDARRRRDFVRAADFAERLLQADEWREDAIRALMAARYESGDRSAAIAAFERFAQRLGHELGVEPMPETIALRDAMVAGFSLVAPAGRSVEGADANPADNTRMPLVGRREEIEALARSWSRAARGFGTTVFLSGEAGIGKSRLAAELAAIVESQGGRALIGATALPEQMPYQALIAAAQRGLSNLPRAAIDDVWLAALADILPEVRVLRPDLAPAGELDAGPARARFHEGLARFFDALARVRPLLLILEDMHWAREDTIAALDALTRRANASPLLVLVTYRNEEVDAAHPLRKIARALQSERRATRVLPAPLDAPEIAAIVTDAFAPRAVPDNLAEEIARVSEGNPLFVLQLVRDYLEDDSAAPHRLPTGRVTDAILSRVARLPADVRAVADVAATVGREFTVDLVIDGGGWSERIVSAALDELLSRQLIRESGVAGVAYTFTHALIASAIYAHTDEALRPDRHRRIAKSLATASDGNALTLGTIALHFERAGDRPGAAAAYLGAARAALSTFARSDAGRFARCAADMADDDALRFAALELAVDAHAGGDDIDTWRSDVEAMEAIGRRADGQKAFAALKARASFELQTGSSESILASARAVLAHAERDGDLGERVVALGILVQAELRAGRIDVAIVNVRAALDLAAGLHDPHRTHELRLDLIKILVRRGDVSAALEELAIARSFLNSSDLRERIGIARVESVIATSTENPKIVLRMGDEYLADAQRAGDMLEEAKAHVLLGYGEHSRGNANAMREHFSIGEKLFARLGTDYGAVVTAVNRSTFELEIGRLDEVERALADAEKLPVESRSHMAILMTNSAHVAMLRGDMDRAQAHAGQALALAKESGEGRIIGECYALLGAIEVNRGERATGFANFARGVSDMRDAGANGMFADYLCAYAEVLLAAGDVAAAQAAANELRAYVATHEPLHPARVAALFANLAAAAGDAPEARKYWAEARRRLEISLAHFDAIDAAAYRALPFIRAIGDAEPLQ